jgi:branched-chain amino acid transport system ATP-binding protein
MEAASPILVAHGIHKRFGALVVLDGIDFVVQPGEAVGIVGPNGAGKTTLLSVLSGAQLPNAGSVSFRGEDVTGLGAPLRCRRGLARTHQIPRPFSGMTVFENVYVAASQSGLTRDQSYERAVGALTRCGIAGLANRQADTLGLLDRKRLELARALGTGPSLLLLDEIGGGLTDAEATELVEAIQALQESGIGIVWIEHIVHVLVQVAQRLICLNAGKIIADGDPAAVMANKEVVEAYLGGAAP